MLASTTPPELAVDIFNEGIFFVGGSALLCRLVEALGQETRLKVRLADDALIRRRSRCRAVTGRCCAFARSYPQLRYAAI